MPSFEDIREDFAFLDDWDDRYKYLIDLGRALPPYPEEHRDDAHKVRGCASQVWLHVEEDGERLRFYGDSDAHIVKGLIALLLALHDNQRASDILKIDVEDALAPFDLADHLTPQRSNGLAAMRARLRAVAEAKAS